MKRRISDGAFPPVQPDPEGNHEQRRAWRAIQRKAQKERRRAAAAEMKKLPGPIRKLLKANRELEDTIERKKEQEE